MKYNKTLFSMVLFCFLSIILYSQEKGSYAKGDFVLDVETNTLFKIIKVENDTLTMYHFYKATYESQMLILLQSSDRIQPYLPKKFDKLNFSNGTFAAVYKDVDDLSEKYFSIRIQRQGETIVEYRTFDLLKEVVDIERNGAPFEVKPAPKKKEVIPFSEDYCFFSMKDLLGGWEISDNFYYEVRSALKGGKKKYTMWLKEFDKEEESRYGSVAFKYNEEDEKLWFFYQEFGFSPQFETTKLKGEIKIGEDGILKLTLRPNKIGERITMDMKVDGFSFYGGRRSVQIKVDNISK